MNISVVIPTLNESDSIGRCLENIRYQLRSGDEIIIIDGGSEDGTISIAKEYGAKVYIAEDSTIGEARHIGVKKSSNGIIATTDADTLPPDGWVSLIRRHFEEDEDLTVLWGSIVDVNGVPIRNIVARFSTITGGASGNNTAFRRKDYLEVGNVYPDVNFMEDAILIYRLALHGKAKRDENLIMVMNMERDRYQTKPIIGMGASLFGLSYLLEGNLSDLSKGASVGLVGTELTYENATDTPFHHDQVGLATAALGYGLEHNIISGVGFGMVAHHDLTEGISLLPTDLEKGTDIVIDRKEYV